MDAEFWDERYGRRDQLFSGAPNGVLVTEISDVPPGRVLDVGCGEGGDARWLAARGWHVTAIDISQVALDRAAASIGPDLAGRITWTRSDLTKEAAPAGPFDLVSVHYFPLPRETDHAALRGLLDAVAPGGTLLFAGHDLTELPPAAELGVDPTDFYQPAEVATLLGPGWTVQVNETRARTTPAPAGTRHAHDTVLRARRT